MRILKSWKGNIQFYVRDYVRNVLGSKFNRKCQMEAGHMPIRTDFWSTQRCDENLIIYCTCFNCQHVVGKSIKSFLPIEITVLIILGYERVFVTINFLVHEIILQFQFKGIFSSVVEDVPFLFIPSFLVTSIPTKLGVEKWFLLLIVGFWVDIVFVRSVWNYEHSFVILLRLVPRPWQLLPRES